MNDDAAARKSLFSLIADLPRLVIGQVKNEVEQFKRELIGKLKHAGIGVGLFAGAGFVAFFLFAVLIGNIQNFLQSLTSRTFEYQMRRRDMGIWMGRRNVPLSLVT